MPYLRSRQTADQIARYARAIRGFGQVTDPEFDPSTVGPVESPVILDGGSSSDGGSGGSSFNLDAFLTSIGKFGSTATGIIHALQQPKLIAGTQAIYNPATGQFYDPVTGQVVNPGGTSRVPFGVGSSLSPGLILGGIGLLAVVVIAAASRGGK